MIAVDTNVLPVSTVVERLRHIAGLSTVEVADAPKVDQALRWYEAGMDFADALHLALASPEFGLATLDQRIQSAARRLELADQVVLNLLELFVQSGHFCLTAFFFFLIVC